MGEVKLLLPPTRLESPSTAGLFQDIELEATKGCADDEQVSWHVLVHGAKSTDARIKAKLDHSPDGRTTGAHTATLISSTTPAAGDVLVGDMDGSALHLDWLHPVLQIGSDTTGDQWVMVSVWQVRKRFEVRRPAGSVRKLGTYRLESGSMANTDGYALPALVAGQDRRVVSYHVSVLEASASAQLGVSIQHGPNGEDWAAHQTHSPASISAPSLEVYDCDTDAVLGPFVRAVLKMQSTAGERALVEVWEISKTV